MNTTGTIFRLTTAGESHGPAYTGIVDGMPAGVSIDIDDINRELAQRRPGAAVPGVSARHEDDCITILSGIADGITTGTPIAFTIANGDSRPCDYERLRGVYRPSHADYTYHAKYGIYDHRGGGRASARETAMRVAAGAMAMAALRTLGIDIIAYTSRIGNTSMPDIPVDCDMDAIYSRPMRCPDADTDARMATLVSRVAAAGDSIGGIAAGIIRGLPAGIGEPVYDKFHARLAAAMMSINAAKGFDYGMGFDGACRLGSEMNDTFIPGPDGSVTTLTNHSGGIQGGITNGNDVTFRVAFKPAATLMRDIVTVDHNGRPVTINPGGRHDACLLPRAIPVVRAMAAITTLDAILLARSSRL